jgi:hypothetical protein
MDATRSAQRWMIEMNVGKKKKRKGFFSESKAAGCFR